MGEKKQKSPESDQSKKKKSSNGGDGAKKEAPKSPVTAVLKIEMHCEGCASNIVKCVKAFQGVESVKAEWEANKLTVTGKLDPAKTRDKLAEKLKKKVELVSPMGDPKASEKKTDDKKPKEAQVMTVVLKMSLHCQGCIEKIHRILSKTKGIQEKCIDRQKELITVKGSMDGNALAESLKKNLKRAVEIVPQKKEGGEKKKEGEAKEKEGGGGKKGKGGGGGAKEDNGAPKMEAPPPPPPVFGYIPVDGYGYGYGQAYPNPNPYPYSYPQSVYGSVYPVPDQQMFSDENPNACAVM